MLCNLLNKNHNRPWVENSVRIDYKEDRTQWIKGSEPITIQYELSLIGSDDAALISFINKMAGMPPINNDCSLIIDYRVQSADTIEKAVKLNGQSIDDQGAKEISKKLLTSNLLFLHNSAERYDDYYGHGRYRTFIELVLSNDEQKKLDEASSTVKRKMRQLAKEHKEELAGFLQKLSDKYDVEFSAFEGSYTRRIPFNINLSDKNVEVPINDWGSGTQNRTFILMSILQANRIKTRVDISERITPIVIIEEPESFLHPSAQAEFGKIIRILAKELGIQIITTTHSPYMLNQDEPEANILLCRKMKRKKILDTEVIDTSGENWMKPFAEHLGLNPSEFASWKNLFGSQKTCVMLVEGSIDKAYFDHLRNNNIGKEILKKGIEIVPYGGKDALKNSLLLKFVLSKIDNVYITFDEDCADEIAPCLERLGMKPEINFTAIGQKTLGKQCIEGLLPQRIVSAVTARETDLVLQATSSRDRQKAIDLLKKKYLEEFQKYTNYTNEEIKEFIRVIKLVNKYLPAA